MLTSHPDKRPPVLFVCVKNGGKSQMAAGLMRKIAGNTVTVDSAGTDPGTAINALSAQTLLEVGVDITNQSSKSLTDDLIRAADRVNPAAIAAMAEEGIDISTQTPKILTTDSVRASDVVITMGCGDACPVFPGKRYEDWDLEDPAGKDLATVRQVRDNIRARVQTLIGELLPTGT